MRLQVMRSLRRAAKVIVVFAVIGSVACLVDRPTATDTGVLQPIAGGTSVATAEPEPAIPAVQLVAWHGPVEHLFFHPLVVEAGRAFRDDQLGHGFEDYFVTVPEFRVIIDSLWRNGWTLVDAHRALLGRVLVPVGRRPLVLSEDDVNYYDYFAGRGLASRLVLDSAGEVKAEVNGQPSDDDLVPIVDAEVAEHPELSAQGAKGVLALTGYQGLFGEHHVTTDPAARARVRALATRLLRTGWSFASHTFGHITLAADSVRVLTRDTEHWRGVVGNLLGPVDLLVYPFGSRPSAAGVAYLARAGFPYQFDIDVVARIRRQGGAIVMSRRHVDGLAFAVPGRLLPFFDVAVVRDPLRP